MSPLTCLPLEQWLFVRTVRLSKIWSRGRQRYWSCYPRDRILDKHLTMDGWMDEDLSNKIETWISLFRHHVYQSLQRWFKRQQREMNIKQLLGSLKSLWGQVSGSFHTCSLRLLKQSQIDDSAFFICLWPLDDNWHDNEITLYCDQRCTYITFILLS